ncbi:hypothetical protein HPB52_013233 [Rhipicephalus sanguineus]|uniref:Uncharacterized protein n=1 Tax=Rhipicephalus sanguineus TaxID=34632 RepID=A0A9D4PZS7_RHISA|nr:hypothetical protein HPB52_013233 [Rhipicephalus sanguineus]
MKTYLWVTLISLFAVAYGATLTPQVTVHRPVLSKEAEADALQKTGKTLETVGRLLQGENVPLTEEVQEDLIKALRVASSNGEVLSEDGSEYILPIIIRGVAQGVIAHVVHKKLNKG